MTNKDQKGNLTSNVYSDTECRVCHKQTVKYQVWESSDGAYDDYKFTCMNCGASWWIDGCDS